jgi:hypothetical protein
LEYDILAPLGGIRPIHFFVFVLRRLCVCDPLGGER